MKYAILITPDDNIEIKEYEAYRTINELVDGWYETCGYFSVAGRMAILFCNEEFIYKDNMNFNAIGSTLSGQPIYGNVVLLADGLNEDMERDALPLSKEEAERIKESMEQFKSSFESVLEVLHSRHDDVKPEFHAQVVTLSADEFNEVLFGEEIQE